MDTTIRSQSANTHPSEGQQACCGAEPVARPLTSAQTAAAADRLKALADPTRLRMLELLASQPRPLCVCDITAQFALHQPTISHHLGILRRTGLIDCEKRGVWAFYWVTAVGERSLSAVLGLIWAFFCLDSSKSFDERSASDG